ncbi:MAG: 2-phospho-L-lactate guanylyltransferase, partial [Chloroflexi bacterium]|nr:2-phospho-L-lactate guanylyltransferase [Chloroflexota bacterium]
ATDGLNDAVATGLAEAERRGARTAIVVAGDLPLVSAADLTAAAGALGGAERGAVVCVDRGGAGTNALVLRPPRVIGPAFGSGSAERHLAEARSAGAEAVRWASPAIAFDVDTPADLEDLRAVAP